MAKNPERLYCPLDDEDTSCITPIPVRGPDDPPPYSEIDSAVIVISSAPQAPPLTPHGSGTSGALEYVHQKRRMFLRQTDRHAGRSSHSNPSTPSPIPNSDDSSIPPVVSRGVPLASKSIDVVCPHCKVEIRTSIEKRPGLLAYLSGAVMACLCCFCGCCLIPCCIEECMEVKHTCPNCDGLIGKYRH